VSEQPEPGGDLVIRVPAAAADATATQHDHDEQERADGVD